MSSGVRGHERSADRLHRAGTPRSVTLAERRQRCDWCRHRLMGTDHGSSRPYPGASDVRDGERSAARARLGCPVRSPRLSAPYAAALREVWKRCGRHRTLRCGRRPRHALASRRRRFEANIESAMRTTPARSSGPRGGGPCSWRNWRASIKCSHSRSRLTRYSRYGSSMTTTSTDRSNEIGPGIGSHRIEHVGARRTARSPTLRRLPFSGPPGQAHTCTTYSAGLAARFGEGVSAVSSTRKTCLQTLRAQQSSCLRSRLIPTRWRCCGAWWPSHRRSGAGVHGRHARDDARCLRARRS
jgi:hypothetical protein